MYINKLILLLIFAIGCQPKTNKQHEMQREQISMEYEVELNVRPSFTPEINYKIRKSGLFCSINNLKYKIESEDPLLSRYFSELDEIISENFYLFP